MSPSEIVGYTYLAWDSKTYLCIGYQQNLGYDMVQIETSEGEVARRTIISERAIGRSFHRISNTQSTS